MSFINPNQQAVISKLLEISINISEVLHGFQSVENISNFQDINMSYKDLGEGNSQEDPGFQSQQQQQQQQPAQYHHLFQPQLPMELCHSPVSANGTLYALPITAFKPQSEQLIDSPVMPSRFEFNRNHSFEGIEEHNNFSSQTMELPADSELYKLERSLPLMVYPAEGVANRRRIRKVIKKPCKICHKIISRDMSRHLRTHDKTPRFQCLFPHIYCRHRSGTFNRPYDFKKHLLNYHFKYDDPDIKKIQNLKDKLMHLGTCSCGKKFSAKVWLDEHILTMEEDKQCPYIEDRSIQLHELKFESTV